VSALEIVRPDEAELQELFRLAKRVFDRAPSWGDRPGFVPVSAELFELPLPRTE
jgi:hypothetical protein